ncbi:ROK family transcriptional regulator [Novosphingobium album (ex Liu et al. 2023)]|uniref:ROK family transcriptional regulator n=1 Tax=Novosphingobium album (ex Liu et al. 2023) TaxID=3031130 RepID=A0ABT5WKY4_9SPHN|nr:ROK family transcriptional regulator [Novosphingobium album (ex Liu et al. 2023)]MDE8650704.1 ROK family transcriptional regulator [Novosphingobium album (ex Liu et al. 2023)]
MATMFGNLSLSYRQVLDAVWRNGPSSRAEIAATTGFTRPAISQIVQELTNLGLLVEQASRKGQRGQPARPVIINGSAAFSAGVNFSHSYLEVALVDLAGTLIATKRTALERPDPETIARVVRRTLDKMIKAGGLDRDKLLGVGISMPADFSAEGTWLPHVYFSELRDPAISECFESILGTAVILENDGRVCAIGERVMGVGNAYRTFMLVHIGHGVGGGLVIDGRPYRGALGNAGIMGQYYPYGSPRPSGQDLLETLKGAGIDVDDFDDLERLPDGSEVVERWVLRAAGQLCGDIARVSRFFGPEAVILAGRLPPSITNRLAGAIDLESILRPMDDLPIPPLLASSLGSSAGMIGAASLPIYQSLLPNH